MIGIWSPSSKISRASGERMRPPMSGACAVLAANPRRAPSRKTGFATQMSGRCPVPIHGSLVMRTSPDASVSGGNSRRKCRTVRGRVLMNDGILSVAWAMERPFASVSTHEKSWDSRTTVENEVRTRAAAASSAMEMSRVQRTSRLAASSGRAFMVSRSPRTARAGRAPSNPFEP